MDEEAEVGTEGGGWNWWFVCEECHAAVDPTQNICPVCGRRLKWEEWNR